MFAQFEAVHSAEVIRFEGRQVVARFTGADLRALREWDVGGRRVEVDSQEERVGQFAMVYEQDTPWASYALIREKGCILVWDCISLADIGRFADIHEALAAVPGSKRAAPVPVRDAEIIPFSAFAARRAALQARSVAAG